MGGTSKPKSTQPRSGTCCVTLYLSCRNFIGILRRGHFYRGYPWEHWEQKGISFSCYIGDGTPTEFPQNVAIQNDSAIPTEYPAPSLSMLTPGGERKREREGAGKRRRQPERVAVAIFYNKTHLCVTTTTTTTTTTKATSSVGRRHGL